MLATNWWMILVMVLEFSLPSAVAVGFVLLNVLTGFAPFLIVSYFAVFLIYALGIKRGQKLMARGLGSHIGDVRKGG